METGFYKKRKIDWDAFEVDLFVPHLFFSYADGCGANTLALLTGIPSDKIKNTNRKNPNDWKDSFMLRFLKQKGFIVHPITKCDVSYSGDRFISQNVTDRHVLMMSQLMNKNSASWSVVHNRLWYHNFQICSFSGLSLVNSPTLTCYLVYHPKWKQNNW